MSKLALVVAIALVSSACGGEDPADRTTTDSTSPTSATQPSESSQGAPSVEPASGPRLKVKSKYYSSQITAPEGWRGYRPVPIRDTARPRTAHYPEMDIYTMVNVGEPHSLNEMYQLWRGKGNYPFGPEPRRLPDLEADGHSVLHMVGRGENPKHVVEMFATISSDFESKVEVTFTFADGESQAERDAVTAPVLATWTFED